ncbi:MAG: inositol-3-phosphate synthase, partial [Sphingomonas sp.]
MNSIRIAVVGIGNCASSLVQGLEHYREGTNDSVGLMHWEMGGYKPSDIKVVAAWDVDKRKVGKDVAEAIFAKPNCTAVFAANIGNTGTVVKMGRKLDGVADHMADFKDDRTFLVADAPEPTREEVIAELKASGADVLMNYLPVGSQEATEFYADCAIEAGVAFVNNIPVFIASNPVWAKKFEDAGVAIIGDDIKAQLGATIVHRVLTDLFAKRGVK